MKNNNNVTNTNSSEQNVAYVARLHWLLFFWPVLFALLTLYAIIQFPSFRELAMVFFAFSLFWVLMVWFVYYFSSLTVENKRVIFRTGFLVRKTTDIPFSKIESIDIRQSLMGSLLGYGALMITGSGGSRQYINFLAKPLTCRRYIEMRMNEAEME